MSESPERQSELLWGNEILVDPGNLQQGHFVARMDRPWIGTPFPLEGVLISDKKELDWFRQHCAWLVVDLLRSSNRYRPPRHSERWRSGRQREWSGYLSDDEASINVLRRARLDREIVSEAVAMHDLLLQQADALIASITRSGRIDSQQIRRSVSQIARSLETNMAAMVWLTRIKRSDQYTARHCVNVAILSMGLAQALEWQPDQVELAGAAGMLHDLGKMKLDPEILTKRGSLSDEEYEHVKQHANLGYQMLRGDAEVHPSVKQAVLEHHERPDGAGYPNGRDRVTLQPLSTLISAVDAYDAITSTRPYRKARSHHEALGELWKARDSQFDSGIVEALIQFLGWITPGTVVRLSNGKFAIVLRASNQHRLWPLVRLLEPDEERYRITRRLDLARYNSDHPEKPIRVAEVLPDDALEIELHAALQSEGSAAD
ncbi:MAG: HD domain-containing phosphohydrolase [Wenzhouxiangellaceae bacterium]